ncbi:Flp pilus assembly protein [Cenarchaeum symbiosum A]|uniref:Flp pilus assembly protein n=1 Tax=Cenarchaeum symbiosum (strain A) TaxID=414004 RepID=A0RVG0_CENSY|nr:Flp pilus assembly protein [Cenarchaeum symbiosum A]
MRAGLALAALFASMWGIVLLSDGGAEYVTLVLAFLAACIVLLAYPLIPRGYSARTRDGDLSVRRFRFPTVSSIFAAAEGRIPPLRRIREYNESLLSGLAPASGRIYDSERLATTSTRIAAASAPPAAALAIILGVYADPLFVSAAAAPAAPYFAPYLQLRSMVGERRARVEEEMAYFLCYANIMESIGFGLYQSFEMIRGRRIFPGMERDAGEVVKRVKALGMTPRASLAIYGESHPSGLFRDFVAGYLAKVTATGGIPRYVEEKARYFFDEYLSAWNRYEKGAQEIFSGIMMVTIVLPMMIMFSSMIGTPEASGVMLLAGTAVSPFIAVIMVVMLNSSQPVTGNTIRTPYAGLAAGPLLGLVLFAAGAGAATAVSAGFLAGGVAHYIGTVRRISAIKEMDAMLPEWMRDVTELSKTGSNIAQIVSRQAGLHTYRGEFGRIIAEIGGRVAAGVPFAEAVRDIGGASVHVRFIMFLLSRIYSTGGGSTDILNGITEFVTRVHQAKENVSKSLRPLSLIVYAAPFLMLGIAHMMIAMFSGTGLPEGAQDVPFTGIGSVDPAYIDGIGVMAALSSIPTGLVAAKISSYTIHDTLPLIIVSGTTLAALHLLPVAVPLLGF